MWLWINNNNNNSEKKKWKIRVLIPVPPACKAGALPFELIPQTLNMMYSLRATVRFILKFRPNELKSHNCIFKLTLRKKQVKRDSL